MSAIAVVEYEEVEENNEIDVAEGASAIIELRTAREHLAAEY